MERVIGGDRKARAWRYGGSLWFFLRYRWISALIWLVCLIGTIYLFHACPRRFCRSGDSGVHLRVCSSRRKGPRPSRCASTRRHVEKRLQDDPNVDTDVHGDGQCRSSWGRTRGFVLSFLNDAEQAARKCRSRRWPSEMMGDFYGRFPG